MEKMDEFQYDNYLLTKKQGRVKRLEKFNGLHKNIKHQCLDKECSRIWKPSPIQFFEDDYYCPSCVLHHRNNMSRFLTPRLEWTSLVPNTFYVFSIVDPKYPSLKIIKFGRTQHMDAKKRYPSSEINDYQMKLILQLRGSLITMTRIENWWKTIAKEKKMFHKFSNNKFHGATECILIKKDDELKFLLDNTNRIFNENSNDPNNDGKE